jgi:O-antigen ligase
MHCVLSLKKIVYLSWLSSVMLCLGARSCFQSRVLPGLFVATLLVIVPSSLGLVRSVTLCPLMIFVIKNLSFSVVVSFLLSEYFWVSSRLFLEYPGSLAAYCNVFCESCEW